MATLTFDATVNNNWNNVGNWAPNHNAVPTAAEDVVVSSGVTSLVLDAAGLCKSLDLTGTSPGITVSGTENIVIYGAGNFKLDTNVTWNFGGFILFGSNGTVTINTGGVNLGNTNEMRVGSGAQVVLGYDLNLGARPLGLYTTGSQFSTGASNYAISCGKIYDVSSSGSPTLALGSSTVTCTYIDFSSSTPTVTSSAGAAINCTPGNANATFSFGGVSWGSNTTITITTNNTFTSNLTGTDNATLFCGSLILRPATSAAATVTFPYSVTTKLGSFSADPDDVGSLTLTSFDGATAATLSDTAGTNTCKNCAISYINVEGGAYWSATVANGNTVANSTGWNAASYSRGDVADLPTNDDDLETIISDKTNINSINQIYISQTATGQYAIFLFKDVVTGSSVDFSWYGKSDLGPNDSIVKLQVYKRTGSGSPAWVDLVTDNATLADVEFYLNATLSSGSTPTISECKDASNVIATRVWQQAV